MIQKHKDKIILLVTVIALYGGMQLVGITCPIKYVTGVSCAGCGMTRAWISLLLYQDPALAMHYHPLFWLVIPAGLLYVFREKLPKKCQLFLLWLIVACTVAVYLYRMIGHVDDIVVFEPEKGLIGRQLFLLWKFLSHV